MSFFFKLLNDSELKNFNDFKEQKKSLKWLTFFFIGTFFFRAAIISLLGHYEFILSIFYKYLFFLIISTIFEVPNMFYMYYNHYKSFEGQHA